uniref:Secreted protein n=1 Tax=Anopheles darlingi TaxID=43151 RepID=A0A2M4D431_ANODA
MLDVSWRNSLMAFWLLLTLFDSSARVQLRFFISLDTFDIFRAEQRAMSELIVFCFLMYSFRCSTVLMISCGTWASFALVPSFLPSTDFGILALMSTPPNPIVLVVVVAAVC